VMANKICKCGNEYIQYTTLQTICVPCALVKGRKTIKKEKMVAAKEERSGLRLRRKKLETTGDRLKKIQIVFNRYIRLRDYEQPCISCLRWTGKKVNAGHFLSVGSHPELRFSPINVWRQCEHCNTYKSGNQAAYETNLRERIGDSLVDLIKSKHPPMQLKKADCADYEILIKRLLKFQIAFNKDKGFI
jgi:hypothetical protein